MTTIQDRPASRMQAPAAATTLLENPLPAAEAATRAGANMYGAFSIETFCDVGPLQYTHEDVQGWLAYTEQFTPRNFWYQDAGVKVWAYYEDLDNWQDTYGMDAVRASYHSGHGGMDANGVFYVPMGAAWAGNDCTATSKDMRLGNEHCRYVFWSTCESLRVLAGHTPLRTWGAANLGLRMIFGFETVSWDDARYGSGFWGHWKRGESLGTAWLNSSWDIAHDQAPPRRRRRTACSTSATSTAPGPAPPGGGGAGTTWPPAPSGRGCTGYPPTPAGPSSRPPAPARRPRSASGSAWTAPPCGSSPAWWPWGPTGDGCTWGMTG